MRVLCGNVAVLCQHGIFMEFCKHGQSAVKYEKDGPPLKLVKSASFFNLFFLSGLLLLT